MHSIPQKRCSKCGVEKPLSEFYLNRRAKDGHQYKCKVCHKKVANDYVRRNSKAQTEKTNAWRRRNRDRYLARRRVNRDKDRANASYRAWYERNRDRENKRAREFIRAHLEQSRIRGHRRRARIAGNGGSYTQSDWDQLCAQYNYRCLRCGEEKPLTVDHVLPISLGGTNDISNLQPLCKSCNSSKNDKFIDYR